VERISREEMLEVIHPNQEAEKPTGRMEFVEWGGAEAGLARDFRTQHPGASLDDSNDPEYRMVRMRLRAAVSSLREHVADSDQPRRAKLDRAAAPDIERTLKMKLIGESPDIQAKINASLAATNSGKEFNQDSTSDQIIGILENLPADLLADIMIRIDDINVERRGAKVEALSKMVEKYKSLASNSRDSLIPQSAKDRLSQLTDSVILVFSDPLTMHADRRRRSDDKHDFSGMWEGRENRVYLMGRGSIHVLVHEYTHGLSSSRPRRVEVVDTDGGQKLFVWAPVGLSETAPIAVDGQVTEATFEQRRWLNEAVTELITAELIAPLYEDGQATVLGYPLERRLFALLLTKGKKEGAESSRSLGVEGSLITESVITEAYFEDRDPSLPPTLQRAKQKELFRQISELYSPGFLNRLDSIERLLGVEVAVAIMEQPDFDPNNDGLPFLRSQEQADLYFAELRDRGIVASL
jgi:hypothetical protein